MAEIGTIAAIVLAAGRSTRMGTNKLIADIGGKPMVRRVAEAALESAAAPVLVVTGHQEADVRIALTGLDVILVHNPNYAQGLSTSLKAGIAAMPTSVAGALVLLGDMPQIAPRHLDQLIAAHRDRAVIIVPVHAGKRGNPVLWPRAFFPAMLTLEGDAGAKRLLAANAACVQEVDLGTEAIFLDVDTAEALGQLRASGAPRA
ncbi:MAG: nucleotidyltransferase family protein [Hyphomicrobiaceae bacterium]|nr:nucleotidyltransferase family protein [Hyphomicrobiaceae bacterium]